MSWSGRNSALTRVPRGYPQNTGILFETNREQALQGATSYLMEAFTNIWVVDRLATAANWARITP